MRSEAYNKMRRYRIEYRDLETGELRETIEYAVSRVAARQRFFAGNSELNRQYLWCFEIE